MTGIATSWDRHWVVVTWWTAAMATGWIVIAVLVAGLPDLTPPGGSGFPTFFELLPAGLAALGATLYVAIAATAVLVIIVPVSASPVRQEPTRGLAQGGLYAVYRGGDGVHRSRGCQDGRQPGHCAGNQLTAPRDSEERRHPYGFSYAAPLRLPPYSAHAEGPQPDEREVATRH